jgi:hypothetical protein
VLRHSRLIVVGRILAATLIVLPAALGRMGRVATA